MKKRLNQAEASALQFIFKPGPIRNAVIKVSKKAASAGNGGQFWPDEVDLDDIDPDDKNCIGNAFKMLTDTLGVIRKVRPLRDRRSRKGASRSRTIFMYRTIDVRRARQIARLAPTGQMELLWKGGA